MSLSYISLRFRLALGVHALALGGLAFELGLLEFCCAPAWSRLRRSRPTAGIRADEEEPRAVIEEFKRSFLVVITIRFISGGHLGCCRRGVRVRAGPHQRQLQREDRALADAFALHAQVTAHFLGGQRAAVKAETVAVLARGETMVED